MADSIKIRITGDDSSYRKTLSGLGSAARTAVKGLTVAAAAVSAAWSAVGVVGVRYNAQIEQLQTSFEVMTGSAEKGAAVLERIRQIAAATPFETEGLASTVQLLMNYNLTADEAINSMEMLGDISQGNQDKLSRIAMAYGQMSSAGKVMLEDVKQMIEAGFNPLAEISETTGESMASLYDRISAGKVTVDEITASMVRATSEGGKYFQSMEKQSQTLNGQLSTLKDNAMSLLGDVMTPLTDELRDSLLPMANELLGEFATAFEQGGFDGLLDAITGKVPDLLNAAVDAGNKVITGLAKWLPGAMQQIATVLPNALRSVLDMGPQLVSALFDVASGLVSDLITMLPELVPMIVEGIGSLVPAILDGVGDILTGIFDGIEQAFHHGMTEIAGVWVDNEGIQAVKVGLDADIDVSDIEGSVESAFARVRRALQTDLLTDEQRQTIIGMIGEDYDAVKAALMSFGLAEDEAGEIAEAFIEVQDAFDEAYANLDLSIDSATLARLSLEAGGSKLTLMSLLEDLGLDDGEIAQITDTYDDCITKIGSATPSILQEIYDKLTDGEPDDEQTVNALKEEITGYVDGLLSSLEGEYTARSAELDTTAADYQSQKEELDAWYESTKSDITLLNTEMTALVDTLAGAPTAVVQARLDELAQMEQQLIGIEDRISGMNEEMASAAQNAFEVVRSGANADQETIGLAINFKATEFKIDEQSAQDAYDAAIEELNDRLANDPSFTTEDYDAARLEAESTRDAAVAQARTAYEQALAAIFQGIAESEGNEAAMQDAMEAVNAQNLISDFLANMFTDAGEVNTEALSGVSEAIAGVLGDAFNPDMVEQYLAMGDESAAAGYLSQISDQINASSSESISMALGGKLGEAYAAALEGGFLSGTNFDTSSQEAQLAAILGAIGDSGVEGFSNSLANGAAAAESGASTMAQGALSGAQSTLQTGSPSKKFYQIGQWAGQGLVNGLNSKYSAVYAAARRLAQAAESGARITLRISSPSKVFEELGMFTGEGFLVGYEKSIREAQRTVRSLTGGLISAANFPARGTVTVAQNAQTAGADGDDLSRLNVGLYISDRKIAEATADANARVSNARSKRLAAGWGHAR